MRDDTGPFTPTGLGKPALIGINSAPQAKVVEIADYLLAGRCFEELDSAVVKGAFDQPPMEGLKECAGEGVHPPPPLPRGAMQRLQFSEKFQRLLKRRCRGQAERASLLKIAKGPAQLLAGVGAQHRVEFAAARRQQSKVNGIGRNAAFAAAEATTFDGLLRQARHRAAEIKLVSLMAHTGEPSKSRVIDLRLAAGRGKDAVMFDRERVEAGVADLVEMETA